MPISITRPTVNGSNNTWGTTLNQGLEAIESTLNGTGTGKVRIEPDLTQGSWEIGGTAVTVTAGELNILDGDTAATSTTLATADRIVVNDNGTMKQVALSDLNTFIAAEDVHPNISAASSVNNSGSTFIQDITVDDNGHITGITSATQNVGSSIAGLAYGAVGTYVWGWVARSNAGGSSGVQGATISGSHIEPAGFYGSSTQNNNDDAVKGVVGSKGGSSLSGTWRIMGREQIGAGYTDTFFMTLFLRIS